MIYGAWLAGRCKSRAVLNEYYQAVTILCWLERPIRSLTDL